MLRSLRSSLILASILWTGGLLMFMHMLSLTVIHAFPPMRGMHSILALVVGAGLMAAGLLRVRHSLRPFRSLREKLIAVRTGSESGIHGAYPSEVQPLIDNLNSLIEDRERAVKRAVAAAGDLAHGLKTPLALLAQEANRAAVAGNLEMAENLGQQVERMSRLVNYHLARARAAVFTGTAAARCALAPCTDALIRTVLKLHAGRDLAIRPEIERDLCVRVNQEDLEEILGNLLDNACKWARLEICLRASLENKDVIIFVDDDGLGLPQDLRFAVLERGVRLDETAPGSGLGLAIVRDLVELYSGAISLHDSPLGGLRVRISLPGT